MSSLHRGQNSTFAVFAEGSTIIVHLSCVFKRYPYLSFALPALNVIPEGIFLGFSGHPVSKPTPTLPLGVPGIAFLLTILCLGMAHLPEYRAEGD